ncbi:MAG: tRNA (adenosine(37)-N6)-threonylcarbamoyltransferase complex dimerization subunit type 1 TsaB [Pseudomonadota bacterium]
MLCLGLNTAGPACDIAIAQDSRILAELAKPMTRGQDAELPSLVEEACSMANVRLNEFQRIGVVTGPGSFTGVRIGVAFARGLALASNADCVGVSTLEAALPEGQQGSAIVVLPAQKRAPDITFWTQTFRSGEATAEPREQSLGELVNLLEARPHMVFGSADQLQQSMPALKIQSVSPAGIRAAQLAAIYDPEQHRPRPTYGRKPDALLPGGIERR